MLAAPKPEVTELLVAWSNGNEEALSALAPLVQQELHKLARRYLSHERAGHTLQPSDLVNEAYLHSAVLSADRQTVALVARVNGADKVQLIALSNGNRTTLTKNTDPTMYYSGLSWASNGKAVLYSKQTSWALVSLIEKF